MGIEFARSEVLDNVLDSEGDILDILGVDAAY